MKHSYYLFSRLEIKAQIRKSCRQFFSLPLSVSHLSLIIFPKSSNINSVIEKIQPEQKKPKIMIEEESDKTIALQKTPTTSIFSSFSLYSRHTAQRNPMPGAVWSSSSNIPRTMQTYVYMYPKPLSLSLCLSTPKSVDRSASNTVQPPL